MSFLTAHQIISVGNMNNAQSGYEIKSANAGSDTIQKICKYITLLTNVVDINEILHKMVKKQYGETGIKHAVHVNMTGMNIDHE